VISGGGNIANVNNPSTSVANLGIGINTLQWTVSNGICPDVSDQINITVFTPPSSAQAGADVQICVQSTSITATAPTNGTGSWSVTQGSAAISSPNSPVTDIVILSPGGATFTWQVSSGSCPATSDELVVTLLSGSDAADAGTDVTIALGDSTILNATGGTVNGWNPPSGLSCINCPNPVATPDTTTMYYVLLTDDNGCKSTDSMLVTVDESAGWYLPNAFTPDNNGVNDFLYFYGTGVKDFRLSVFDRWGEQVFETTDFKNGWDGTFKNKPVLAGVYVYQLTITFKSSKVEEVSGNINLIRN
jgi:gliding motility-associated-like protein